MKLHKGTILYNEKICKDTYKLQFKSDLEKILPGQFISILCPPKTLRRPFGVVDFENGILTVLYKMRGDGTKYLSELKIGDIIDFNAPLGQPFIPFSAKRALLIGAGIGIAPLFYLNKKLKNEGVHTKIINGVNLDAEVISGVDYTKIGGTILDDISRFIEEFKPDIVYCCAPHIVLKLTNEICEKYKIPVQVALERTMACGIGVCRSCVVKIKTQNGIENRAICSDGPVFWGSEVVWQ